jgi:hypothetical protein
MNSVTHAYKSVENKSDTLIEEWYIFPALKVVVIHFHPLQQKTQVPTKKNRLCINHGATKSVLSQKVLLIKY